MCLPIAILVSWSLRRHPPLCVPSPSYPDGQLHWKSPSVSWQYSALSQLLRFESMHSSTSANPWPDKLDSSVKNINHIKMKHTRENSKTEVKRITLATIRMVRISLVTFFACAAVSMVIFHGVTLAIILAGITGSTLRIFACLISNSPINHQRKRFIR